MGLALSSLLIFGVPFTQAALLYWCLSYHVGEMRTVIYMWLNKDWPETDHAVLAVPLLTQPRVQLAVPKVRTQLWLLPSLYLPRSHIPCCRDAPNQCSTSLSHCMALFLARCRTWHLSTWNFLRFLCWPISTASPSLSGWWPCPQGYQLVTLIWCHLQIWIQCSLLFLAG